MNHRAIRKSSDKGSVTMRDIARELDISHATVSMALRDHARITETTRDRVKKKAREMGYHKDPILSALSHYRNASKDTARQTALAWINPYRDSRSLYQQKEFSLYWEGARDAAKGLGFCLEEFPLEDYSLKQMDTIFKSRNIRGILVAPVTNQAISIQWDKFPWEDYSAIRFGRSEMGPPIHYVTSAQAGNTMLAFRKMREKGYSRIGYVGRTSGRCMFVSGYLGSQLELPEELRLPPLLGDDHGTAPSYKALDDWMKKNRPDAILVGNTMQHSMLSELGYDIPGDVSIATMSIHDSVVDAGIDQNPREIGSAAIRMLSCLLNEQLFGIPAVQSSILVDGKWVDGSMLPDRRPI
jgi:DNA-binding LacI/PurR family transcriptional regulator